MDITFYIYMQIVRKRAICSLHCHSLPFSCVVWSFYVNFWVNEKNARDAKGTGCKVNTCVICRYFCFRLFSLSLPRHFIRFDVLHVEKSLSSKNLYLPNVERMNSRTRTHFVFTVLFLEQIHDIFYSPHLFHLGLPLTFAAYCVWICILCRTNVERAVANNCQYKLKI